MSYRNRRQSIYLQRNSISRTNSYVYESSNRKTMDNGPIPLPDLKTMKVYKGYEFVTFKPVHIMPPSSSEESSDSITSLNTESVGNDDLSSEIIESRVNSFDSEWISNLRIEEVTESEARDCLHQHIRQNCCYEPKAARDMSIIDVHHTIIVRYSLESLCERRQLCWTFEPYLDPDSSGSYASYQTPPDDPWKISVHQVKDLEELVIRLSEPPRTPQPPTFLPTIKETDIGDEKDTLEKEYQQSTSAPSYELSKDNLEIVNVQTRQNFQEKIFQDQCMEVTVPGTISIHSCHVCAGVGRKRCIICAGSGSIRCEMCDGAGYFGFDHQKSAFPRTFNSESNNDYCWRCRGRGRLRCDGCIGVGMTFCAACAGSGQIKCFIKMIITLTNHHNSVIIRDHYSSEIPFDQVKMVDGSTVLDEDGLDLYPTSLLFDHFITNECRRLIKLHRRKYLCNSKLLLQRHRIKVIPVVRVNSSWRGNRFRFYIFSQRPRRKCFTIDYPQRCYFPCCCFCCCRII